MQAEVVGHMAVCPRCKARPGGPWMSECTLVRSLPCQVRAWAQDHNLGNPATGLWVYAQADEE